MIRTLRFQDLGHPDLLLGLLLSQQKGLVVGLRTPRFQVLGHTDHLLGLLLSQRQGLVVELHTPRFQDLGHTDLRLGQLLSHQLVALVELRILQFQVLDESVLGLDQVGSKAHNLHFLVLEVAEIGGHRHVEVFRHLWIFRLHHNVAVTPQVHVHQSVVFAVLILNRLPRNSSRSNLWELLR